MTFGIFSVLVSQINVLESYLDICFKENRAFGLLHQDFSQILVLCLPLVPVVKILKKNWGHRKNLGESGGKTFKGSDLETCQF